MIEETKNIYDTNSARYFRNSVLNYMDVVSAKIDIEIDSQIDILDTIEKQYSEMLNIISTIIANNERN